MYRILPRFFIVVSTVNNTYGAGKWPPLLTNVNCTQTHSRLSQCVHPQEIGLNACLHGTAGAGVSCEAAVTTSPAIDLATTQVRIYSVITTSTFRHPASTIASTLVSTTELMSTPIKDTNNLTPLVFTTISMTAINSTTSILPQNRDVTTDMIPAAHTNRLIAGVVGGVLALVVIVGIIAVFLAIIVRRRSTKKDTLGGRS